jgi:hypothetical protein
MVNLPLETARYIALTTYRRDGRPVTTPVWPARPGRRRRALAALRGKYGWQLWPAMLVSCLRGDYRDRGCWS